MGRTAPSSRSHKNSERPGRPLFSAVAAVVSQHAAMVSLKLQKRLAASVLKCGVRKVWLDPNEVTDISTANSRTFLVAALAAEPLPRAPRGPAG